MLYFGAYRAEAAGAWCFRPTVEDFAAAQGDTATPLSARLGQRICRLPPKAACYQLSAPRAPLPSSAQQVSLPMSTLLMSPTLIACRLKTRQDYERGFAQAAAAQASLVAGRPASPVGRLRRAAAPTPRRR